MTAELRCGRHRLSLARPHLMGVLNLTPDSFSDGGRYLEPAAAVDRALAMVEEGADLIDLGGESTRPGAAEVSSEDELQRVMPVLERLVRRLSVPVSVDTSKLAVMRAAVAAGAGMINDVLALQAKGALDWAGRQSDVAFVLMHMQGRPRTMQRDPQYGDVVADVSEFLVGRRRDAEAAGVPSGQILCDPGFGFGKSLQHNLQLLRHLRRIDAAAGPLLVGLSRKSMFAHLLGERAPEARVEASVQAALLCAQQGARMIRVHDVAQTRDAMRLLEAVESSDA